MSKTTLAIDSCLLALGTTYSLANIRETIGVIILIVELAWIVTKLVIKIVDAIKNKKSIEDINEDVEDLVDKLEDVVDIIDEEDNENGEGK